MSRYSQPYAQHKGIGRVPGPTPQQQQQAQQASANADIMRLLAGAAPFAGSAIGAGIGTALAPGVGTAAGGAIGGALGQMGGSLLSGGADMQTRKAEDEDAARQAKLSALMAAFGGRGR